MDFKCLAVFSLEGQGYLAHYNKMNMFKCQSDLNTQEEWQNMKPFGVENVFFFFRIAY